MEELKLCQHGCGKWQPQKNFVRGGYNYAQCHRCRDKNAESKRNSKKRKAAEQRTAETKKRLVELDSVQLDVSGVIDLDGLELDGVGELGFCNNCDKLGDRAFFATNEDGNEQCMNCSTMQLLQKAKEEQEQEDDDILWLVTRAYSTVQGACRVEKKRE